MTGLIHQTTKLVIFCILGIGAATSTLAAPPTPISACPYTISTPGSYAVTQNLSVSSIGGNCISLVPPLAGVSIDLQNHSITGSGPNNTGAGAGISCFLTSSGAKCDNVIIVNGTISKFPSAGISIAGDGNIVSGVTATANGGFGVVLGARVGNRTNMVDAVTANGNGSDGIQLGASAFGNANHSVSNSSADGNGGDGIIAFGSVNNCEASNNAQVGLTGTFVSDSKARNNGGAGIVGLGGYAGVFSSTATGNGGGGITAFSGGNVVNNAAQNNDGIGIQLLCPGLGLQQHRQFQHRGRHRADRFDLRAVWQQASAVGGSQKKEQGRHFNFVRVLRRFSGLDKYLVRVTSLEIATQPTVPPDGVIDG